MEKFHLVERYSFGQAAAKHLAHLVRLTLGMKETDSGRAGRGWCVKGKIPDPISGKGIEKASLQESRRRVGRNEEKHVSWNGSGIMLDLLDGQTQDLGIIDEARRVDLPKPVDQQAGQAATLVTIAESGRIDLLRHDAGQPEVDQALVQGSRQARAGKKA